MCRCSVGNEIRFHPSTKCTSSLLCGRTGSFSAASSLPVFVIQGAQDLARTPESAARYSGGYQVGRPRASKIAAPSNPSSPSSPSSRRMGRRFRRRPAAMACGPPVSSHAMDFPNSRLIAINTCAPTSFRLRKGNLDSLRRAGRTPFESVRTPATAGFSCQSLPSR